MLLYSGIITLDYNPTTDVLVTSMPDVRAVALAEVKYCLSLIVDTIRHYHITNLLLDARQSIMEVNETDYQAITTQFAQDLMRTRLQKIARVHTQNAPREARSAQTAQDLRQNHHFTIRVQTFGTPEEAFVWLLAKEQAGD